MSPKKTKKVTRGPQFNGRTLFVIVWKDIRELPEPLQDQLAGYRDESGDPAALFFTEFDHDTGESKSAPARFVLLEAETFLKLMTRDEPDVA